VLAKTVRMSANGRESKDDPQFLCGVAVSVYQNSGGSNQFSGKSAAAVVWKDQLYAKHPDQQDKIYIYVVCTGDPNSNWAWYEKQKMVAVDLKLSLSSGDTSGLDPANHDGTMVHSSWNRLGKSVVMNNERIGVSSDFWNNYAQDIRLAKELGMSCHTLSDSRCGADPSS